MVNCFMRIFQINVVSNWGSTGRIVEELGSMVIDNGGESYIAYSRGRALSRSHLFHIGNKFDIYYHGLVTRIFDRHGLVSKQATIQLIQHIQRVNPDIIHLHNIHGYYLNYPLLFSFLQSCHIPIVWTIHDCWPFTGHCTYFSYLDCQKWKTECSHCPQKMSYPQSLLVDRSKKNYFEKKRWFTSLGEKLTLVPVSDWLTNVIKQSFLANCNIHRIYNGIDTNIFHPVINAKFLVNNRYRIQESKIVLGVSNIWNERKGLDDFVSLRSLLSTDYLILLIGLNRSQISSLPKGIIGLERTDNVEQLVEIYSAADIYVNFSREETFGLTTVEAMSCGTPVLAYDTTALPEIISGNTGVVVSLGDIRAAAKHIREICEMDKDIYSYSCRERVVSMFEKRKSILEYLNLYEKLLQH